MARFILLLAILVIGYIVWFKIKSAKPEDKKKMAFTATIAGVVIVLVILGATGHLSWLAALVGGIIAFLPKLAQLFRYLPLLDKFRQNQSQPNASQQQAPSNSSPMSKEEAYNVLGLKSGAERDEIILAHKRMMQKVHPDRGGSDYLASQINQAKDTLLK